MIINVDELRYGDIQGKVEIFDNITSLVSRIIDIPIVIISLTDSNRTWFISKHGLDDSYLDLRNISSHGDDVCVINDTSKSHSKMAHLGSLGIKFYASVALKVKDGTHVGTFYVLDVKPRTLSEKELEIIKGFATLIIDKLETMSSTRKILSLEANLLKNALIAKEKAEHIANHDVLTGLPNRRWFMHAFKETVENYIYDGDKFPVVYMLDLDKFKSANDTFGHQFGDFILKEVATRITNCIGPHTVAARLGGDEFIILNKLTTLSEAKKLANVLVESLSKPYTHETNIAYLSSSIGLALFDNQRDDTRQLIRHADLALYHAKSNGGKQYQIYNSTMSSIVQTRNR